MTSAIKSISDADNNWEDITSRRIVEVKTAHTDSSSVKSANVVSGVCQICHKQNHKTESCFLNPMNRENKLKLPDGVAFSQLNPPNRSRAQERRTGAAVVKEKRRAPDAQK